MNIHEFIKKYGVAGVSSVLRQITYVCKRDVDHKVQLYANEIETMEQMANDLQSALQGVI